MPPPQKKTYTNEPLAFKSLTHPRKQQSWSGHIERLHNHHNTDGQHLWSFWRAPWWAEWPILPVNVDSNVCKLCYGDGDVGVNELTSRSTRCTGKINEVHRYCNLISTENVFLLFYLSNWQSLNVYMQNCGKSAKNFTGKTYPIISEVTLRTFLKSRYWKRTSGGDGSCWVHTKVSIFWVPN